MRFVNRPFVCAKLAISRWQSYNLFPATPTGMVREADVLRTVNGVARGFAEPFAHMPELVSAQTVEAETGVPSRKLLLWTRRKRRPMPHVRINSHVIRFHRKEALAWLEENSR